METTQVMHIITALLSDVVIFSLLQLYLIAVFIYAIRMEAGWFRKRSNLIMTVKRGEKSWDYFNIAYGVALLILVEIIGSTEAFVGYKTAITIIDVVMLTYLAFFNSWFRNKIMEFVVNSQLKEERM
jgi:hypothetical protein